MLPLTASWLGAKCAADRICLGGACVDAIVDIDAGRQLACGRWASGRVSCWGFNGYGETGYLATRLDGSVERAYPSSP